MNGPHKDYIQAQAWLFQARKLQAELSQEQPSRSSLPTSGPPPTWNDSLNTDSTSSANAQSPPPSMETVPPLPSSSSTSGLSSDGTRRAPFHPGGHIPSYPSTPPRYKQTSRNLGKRHQTRNSASFSSPISQASSSTKQARSSPDRADHFVGKTSSNLSEILANLDVGPSPPAFGPVNDEDVQLSDDQQRVLEAVKKGKNVFFTGPAGTGKSVVMRRIISWAMGRYKGKDSVAVTAPTGIAAVNIKGRSLHSWAGIRLGKEDAETLAREIQGTKAQLNRWRSARVLVIDEISMVDGILFDKLEYIARIVRENDEPFGGIQLVLTGDFFQLPPVPDKSYQYEMASTFTFQSLSWSTCITRPLFLKQVFRQSDTTFIDILSAMREGRMTENHLKVLQALERPIVYTDGIEGTLLFPLKRDVERCNNKRLGEINEPEVLYKAIDTGGVDVNGNFIPAYKIPDLLDRLTLALDVQKLKIGAQVMLIKNVVQGELVNGSVGAVIAFATVQEAIQHHIRIAGVNPDEKRFQGSNEDTLIEVSKALKLRLPESEEKLKSSSQWQSDSGPKFSIEEKWPLVRFTDGRLLLCTPVEFTVVGIKGNLEARRQQVPLILAWALSIHKSQGQTLERVKIDMANIFEKGQAYVALSRARSMDGLQILNFNCAKIQVHPLVLKWQEFWLSLGDDDADFLDSEGAFDSFFEPLDDDDIL